MIAGDGPISNGIPQMLGRGGLSTRLMPKPPRQSKACVFPDDTIRMRNPNTGKL